MLLTFNNEDDEAIMRLVVEANAALREDKGHNFLTDRL
jgi:hypothetical protein